MRQVSAASVIDRAEAVLAQVGDVATAVAG
jgi:hypothetical protein